MILTVTLNTALDITYRVRGLRPHASHRVSEVTEGPSEATSRPSNIQGAIRPIEGHGRPRRGAGTRCSDARKRKTICTPPCADRSW